jgi:two-component system response regulator NreC
MDDIDLVGPTGATVMPANPIRVVVVDDKMIVREGVCALLTRQPGFEIVAQAGSVGEALTLDVRPDVVITDLALPDARGTEVVIALRSHFSQAAIFVLVDDERSLQSGTVAGGNDIGVRGYALKTTSAAEFLAGLRTVAQGLQYVQPSLRSGAGHSTVASLPATMTGESETDSSATGGGNDVRAVNALTTKEREVLRYLVLGHTNAEIASLCGVSLRTVEARRARVLQKLGVRTRAELVRVAQRVGGIDMEPSA